MSSLRLTDRVPSAGFVSIGKLAAHQLRFHKIGMDGSSKCDAEHTGCPNHFVWGAVFEIPVSEKAVLDRYEGLGCGYGEKSVAVRLEKGELVEAATYYALRTDPGLKPFHWYKEHVLRGARENGLPEDYIAVIESVASIADPDHERHERELSIYRQAEYQQNISHFRLK